VVHAVAARLRLPWGRCGRAAALLALEALHRRDGELRDDARLDLGAAQRIDVPR
jgi:hypothetical protein